MSESEFMQAFRKVLRENPQMFDALEEYDRTRRLRKITYKERVDFTIDQNVLRQFRTLCKEKGYAMSKVLENCMREFVKKNH